MTITIMIIVISVSAVIIGLVTIYLAIWSKYGLGEKLDKGFGELRTSGSRIATDIDKRMGDLVEIIRMLVPRGQTVTYELKNIGPVEVSVLDMGENITNYSIKIQQPIFTSRFLVEKATGSERFREKETVFFGKEETTLHSPIPTVLRVQLPSTDKEVCSRFMAFLLKWLDTEYFESSKELAEAESTIGKYLES